MSSFAISQILVGIVFVITAISFQFERRERMLVCFVAITLLMGVHFWLLDALTAALLSFVSSVRYFVAIHWQSRILLYFFLFLVLAAAAGRFPRSLRSLGAGYRLAVIRAFIVAVLRSPCSE